MIDDLTLLDFLYAAVGMACLIGLLILRTRPPTPPVSRWAMRRLRDKQEGER